MTSKFIRKGLIFFLIGSLLTGCGFLQSPTPVPESVPPTAATQSKPSSFDISEYAFPALIDPTKRYLFYLHGKIIEDQGIPAVSPDYGEYEYGAILEKLREYGFVVISEQRAKDTDSDKYAERVKKQVQTLLESGAPPEQITVVGASKGAGIAILVSHLLQNEKMNFVIMAICDPVTVEDLQKNGISLYGNVLSIFDSADHLAGSCQGLFSFSEGKGLSKHDEIVLNVGTGHGVLFKPLDEWVIPVVQWAGNP